MMSFVDLQAQRTRLGAEIDKAIADVLTHGQFILGPEVQQLESALQGLSGANHALTCASGTDALTLILMAQNVGVGDVVFVPAFTFIATAEAIAQLGATPFFVDVRADTFNMDPESLSEAVEHCSQNGPDTPRMIIAVDMFGQPADYASISAIANGNNLILVADAAQSLGAKNPDASVGTLADYTATSFYPSKPLGCYGDGGAVFTDQKTMAETISSLRSHGQGKTKYSSARVGINSRLDTLQAAILLAKLTIFDNELELRRVVAENYESGLGNHCIVPRLTPGTESSWAQYTIRTPHRDLVAAACRERGVPTAIHYPAPLHLMGGYGDFPCCPDGLPVAEALTKEVLSLPMHPYLTPDQQARVVSTVKDALNLHEKAVSVG